MRRRTLLTAVLALALTTTSLALSPGAPGKPSTIRCTPDDGAAAQPDVEETTVTSRADGVEIDITIFKPACATAETPVPVILHSHGWSGTKSSDPADFSSELAAGFGIVSITQRGHGDSGGQARVQDPEFEAQDIKSVIDHVAALPWTAKDTDRAGNVIADDPVLFAMGGSYGGGYQTITALTEIRESGRTRFDALAPEITWFDLPHSLAPNDVVRSEWNEVLYAAGTALVDMHPLIHQSFAWGAATGEWP
ncbi:MAG: CocE/NonD family hydrolase, partial [Nitriliruptorales bacterium]|nr:CocE/NonD family hydrolase [Nitriliruptorales bacterium]